MQLSPKCASWHGILYTRIRAFRRGRKEKDIQPPQVDETTAAINCMKFAGSLELPGMRAHYLQCLGEVIGSWKQKYSPVYHKPLEWGSITFTDQNDASEFVVDRAE